MDIFDDFSSITPEKFNESKDNDFNSFNVPLNCAPRHNSKTLKRSSLTISEENIKSPKLSKTDDFSPSVLNMKPNETISNSPFYPMTPSYGSSNENSLSSLFSNDNSKTVSLSKTLDSPLIALNQNPVNLSNSSVNKYNLPTPVIKVSTSPVKEINKTLILNSKNIFINKTNENSKNKSIPTICLSNQQIRVNPISIENRISQNNFQIKQSNKNTIILKSSIIRPTSVINSSILPTIKMESLSRSNEKKLLNVIPQDYENENSDFIEFQHNEAYTNYEPVKFKGGKPHPYVVIESRSLMSIEAPDITYKLKMPKVIIKNGILSKVQLEAVVYACQKHEELFDGKRYGFLIGDGAGVGKGRTIGGIIFENFLAGRKKAIWVSVSNDLKQDAERDLDDIGDSIKTKIKVSSVNKMSYNRINSEENGNFNEGVLFVTYSSLISKSKNSEKKLFSKRLHQIIEWFGHDYDGVIVFDECHKAKNLQQRSKTKTASKVKKLQDKLKLARIVYASATGASEPKHMAYMVRLGLWGPGRHFSEFNEFESTLTSLGVGAMELIAIEMKKKGVYLARQLSFKDVKFEIQELEVENSTINGHKFKDAYNKCVDVWSDIYQEFTSAFERNKFEEKDEINFEAQFWSAHQRFFKYLCIAGKIEECVKIAKNEVNSNKCVVIGLQSTGEARTLDLMEETSGDLDFVSSAKGVVKSLIENHYPSIKTIEKNKAKKQIKLNRSLSKLKENQSKTCSKESSLESPFNCYSKSSSDNFDNLNNMNSPALLLDTNRERQMLELVEKIDTMLPLNALDQLIHELGGPNKVAEMTGRKGRMIEEDGKIIYHSRKETDIPLDHINILEKDRFNNGDKLFAIISDAASTGISLHSDKRFKNVSQRFHITLELPWSADKAIQQFGRTHRSNQVNPPHYVFLISDLAGERRFAATVAKRLESLGALTHGDRRCADSRDLSQFNLDNEFGLKAVNNLIRVIVFNESTIVPFPEKYMKIYDSDENLFRKEAKTALKNVGLTKTKPISVTKFLNRLLGIQLDMQNSLFQYFLDLIENESHKAKARNEFDHGIRDVMNDYDNVYVIESTTFQTNSDFENDDIVIKKIQNINGISWESAFEKFRKNKKKNGFYSFKNTFENKFKLLAYVEHKEKDTFTIMKPNFPAKEIDKETLTSLWTKVSPKTVEKDWIEIYNESKDKCVHVMLKQNCPQRDCTLGKRTKINYLITGAILLALKKIDSANINKKLEIIRVQLADKTKMIGALLPTAYYKVVINALEKKYSAPKIQKFISESSEEMPFENIGETTKSEKVTSAQTDTEKIAHIKVEKPRHNYSKINAIIKSQLTKPVKSEVTVSIPKAKKMIEKKILTETKEFQDVIINCLQDYTE